MKYTNKTPEWKKLVDYYNQWREEKFNEKGYFQYKNRFDEVHLCSKSMGFIRYLIEKKKIDWTGTPFTGNLSICLGSWVVSCKEREIDYYTDYLVACLSIQDNMVESLLDMLL